MWKAILKQAWTKVVASITSLWHSVYFHWQLKNKTGYILLTAFIFVVISIPTLTYQVVKYKNIQRNIKCLALNVFHEARSESNAGQRAVASVTLNRVDSKRYPDNICDVVYEKNWDIIRKRYVGQFSWTEFDEPPKLKSKAWLRAWKIAETSYNEKSRHRLNGAMFYHAKHIKPSWARKKKPIALIGRHIFYK
ncbi:MAG: cell wall hydrolase [Gammaproteobacteria bacterium]|nr:cell wall hydrolase [Gammaproteobacteria bacterium]MCW9030068.1 cell wall hydrolase [Gammaproteobacteria bacterium]